MKHLARTGAVTLGAALGLVGVMGFLHTPYGRPLMRRLGMACPATRVSPAQVEAVRLRAVATLRGDRPSPARPALGQSLDVSRATDVMGWGRARGLGCVEATRPLHAITCAGAADPTARDPKAPPVDQLVFAFAPDGRLVSVDRLRSRLTPVEATRLFGEAADQLLAALGPGQVVGDASPDYLASGSMHGARLAYRFVDYLATVTAMNVGGRIVMHELYESARGS
ncbi:MAG TPA: hypothetical protein VGP64_06040 [Polyangia bacterium]|jgi:hypothetical protein